MAGGRGHVRSVPRRSKDPSEKVNLANSSEHKAVFAQLTARFKAVSATNAPQAGLVGDALTQDTVRHCDARGERTVCCGPSAPVHNVCPPLGCSAVVAWWRGGVMA